MKLPNILTVSRFGLTAVFMLCLSVSFPGAPIAAVIFFVIGMVVAYFSFGHAIQFLQAIGGKKKL